MKEGGMKMFLKLSLLSTIIYMTQENTRLKIFLLSVFLITVFSPHRSHPSVSICSLLSFYTDLVIFFFFS